MTSRFTLALFFIMTVAATARASDVYVCVGENGVKEYKNTGATKGCKKVDLPSISMIPAPAKKSGAPSTSSKSTASDFPKVDATTQNSRDTERKQILLDEIKAEEQKLAQQKKDYNNGEPERHGDERNYVKYQERTAAMKEELDRTEKNVEALKRELARLAN